MTIRLSKTLFVACLLAFSFFRLSAENPPFQGDKTKSNPPLLVGCGDNFYDPGGATGNYTDYQSFQMTFCPDQPGDFIEVHFSSFETEACCDHLSVYDWDNTSNNYLGAWSGNAIPTTFSATNPSGCLTFSFYPQGSTTASGWEAEVSCTPCPRPNNFRVDKVSGNSAQFSWLLAAPGTNYQWEVGLAGFVPGAGAAVSSGTTGDIFAIADNLQENTAYEAYLRTVCQSGGNSEFAGPFAFRTSPDCGDDFFDTGGPTGNYNALSNPVVTICPDVPGTFVSLDFQAVDLPPCCASLIISNGNNAGWGDLAVFNGTTFSSPLTSMDLTGCLNLTLYQSSPQITGAGWAGKVNCVSCPVLNWTGVYNQTTQGASLQWHQVPAAAAYVWEVGVEGFTPGTGAAAASGTVDVLDVAVTGLESSSRYDVYVTVLCQNGETGGWRKSSFITLPTCGDTFYDSGGPDGDPLPNQTTATVICPEQPGEYVSLNFTEFYLEPCCAYLELFNSNYFGGDYLGFLSGNQPPQTFTATNGSGCISVRFTSNSNQPYVGSGWKAEVECVSCPNPPALTANNPTQSAVDLYWQPTPNALFYHWEIGLAGFTPGTGTAFASGDLNTNQLHVTGLASGTAYQVYVRANCDGNDASVFTGPFAFATAPTCGDTFTDVGGANGDYPAQSNFYQIICPDAPGTFAQLDFSEFDLAACCSYLEIWDSDNFWYPFIGSFTGSNSPGVVSATNPTGCLSVRFQSSSDSLVGSGWLAAVECVTCPSPSGLQPVNMKSSSVELVWSVLSNAEYYSWEVGLAGFTPGTGQAVASGDVNTTNVIVTGLESGTVYQVYLRANCGSGDFSGFSGPKSFVTSPTCGDSFFDPAGPGGDFSGNYDVLTTICPETPGTFVQVNFQEFDLGDCCAYLEAFDFDGNWANYLGNFQNQNSPSILTATTASGCLTFHFVSSPNEPAPGWNASVTCVTCPSPNGLNVTNATGGAVQLNWNQVVSAEFYRWEIGVPGFVPGAGEALFSSNTPTWQAHVNGLEGSTEYEVYVRSSCLGGETGVFHGPVRFTTLPTCGDPFVDAGGADDDYPINQYVSANICPDAPGEYVELTFTEFELTNCCASMSISDNVTFLQYFGTNSPGTVISNASDGCLNVLFQSSDGQTAPGWEAVVNCVSCAYPKLITANGATFSSFDFSWNGLSNAVAYEWEVGLPGFAPGAGTSVDAGSTTQLFASAEGLESSTEYEVYLRTSCGGGEWSTFSKPFKFITAPTCGDHFYDPGGPDANYQPYVQAVTVICPDQPGQSVEVTFNSFQIHGWEDYFYVYDGASTNAPGLGNYFGTNSPGTISANNPTGCLTFSFAPQSGQSFSGWDATVECVACAKVNGVTISDVLASTATLSWNELPGGGSPSYEWEVGLPGFLPGTGAAVASGTSNSTSIQVTGLEGGTSYEAYVRANCGSNGLGNFSLPVAFKTAVACGDFFYDSGGPNGNYNNGESYVTTICPHFPGQTLTVTFNYFSTEGCCDYMHIYDGNSTNAPYIGGYAGSNVPPPLTGTSASGCLTFAWYSDGSSVSSGWEAAVICEGCIAPLNLTASNIASDGAKLSWEVLPSATSYHWEVGAPGFTPGIGASQLIGNTPTNSIDVAGLAAGANYEAYVRGICGSEGPGEFAGPLAFSTLLSCGSTLYDTGGKDGDYSANEDYFVRICPEIPNDTVSLVFKFFETQQGSDLLEILNGNNETSPSLGIFSGNILPGTFTSTDPSGCLMLHFTSNATVHRGGWEAEVVCASTGTNAAGNFEGIFEAFPNPASTTLNVIFTYPAQEMAIVTLLDMTGRKVSEQKTEAAAGSNFVMLDLTELPSGTYFVSLTGAFGTAARRVVKE